MTARRPTVAVDLRALLGPRTGIGVHTEEILRELLERRRFDLLGLAHRPPERVESLLSLGLRCEHQTAPLGVLWQQLLLPARLGRGDVDLFWSPLATLPWRCPVSSVVTVHDLTPVLLPQAHRRKTRWSIRPFLGRSVRTADRVVAVSEATARDLRRLYPRSRPVTVVPNGVGGEFAPATAAAVEAIRRREDAPRGFVLFAGTLEPRKNLEGLLAAWAIVREHLPDPPPLLVAGGRGWGDRRLRSLLASASESGVRVLGRVSHQRLVELLQGATVFVYPSFYEGFGLPPLEAMACGVPVVVSDRSSLPEVVGDAGLLVDPSRPAAIAEALLELLRSPQRARELGTRGLARSRSFTWRRAADSLTSLFEEVLGHRGTAATVR